MTELTHRSKLVIEAIHADDLAISVEKLESEGFFNVSDTIDASAARRLANPIILETARLAFDSINSTATE